MKISKKMISFPPYLSTSWANVRDLQCLDGKLVITLDDYSSVSIPDLDKETITRVFDAHAAFLEEHELVLEEDIETLSPAPSQGSTGRSFELPYNMLANNGVGEMGSMLAHDPQQADAPDLPDDILSKISNVAEILAPEELEALPVPKEDCNCFHCQVTRAVRAGMERKLGHKNGQSTSNEQIEEEVSEEDLRFRDWDIEQAGDKIYKVSNPLDASEHYFVHLKDPIGCTCGHANCEHIEAVLKS